MMPKSNTSSSLPFPLNPAVLLWAREESGLPLERVAHRLNVKVERLASWEQPGGQAPTLRQMQELARFFHRPLSVFFLPSPPQLPPLAAEYRRLPGVVAGKESPELRLAIRQMSIRRDHAINLMDELGEEVPGFKLKAHLNENPVVVADRLRKDLKIDIATQTGWRDEWQAWHGWREAVENLGVLVFQFLKVGLNDARGLSLLRFPLPAVGINSKEKVAGSKSYTLMHELIHLMLAAVHEEETALKEKRSDKQRETVERFAETAASHVLVPESVLTSAIDQKGKNSAWDIEEVRRLARNFRISPLAMATRLRASGYMSWPGYQDWKKRWDAYLETLRPRSGGIASPAEKAINRNGKPFVQLVLEALQTNRIASAEAAHYLDLKFQHFEELRENIRFGTMRSESDD